MLRQKHRWFIVGSYYEQPSPALQKNLGKAKRLLQQHGVPPSRFYVRAAPSIGMRDGDESEPKYPNLFVVEIYRETARKDSFTIGSVRIA
jgi:hypothetical protein